MKWWCVLLLRVLHFSKGERCTWELKQRVNQTRFAHKCNPRKADYHLKNVFLDKSNKLAATLLQYFNLKHARKACRTQSERKRSLKTLEMKNCCRRKNSSRMRLMRFIGFKRNSITSSQSVTQFFIRTHVYRETMKHEKYIHVERKIITFKALFAIMTYNFSISPQNCWRDIIFSTASWTEYY